MAARLLGVTLETVWSYGIQGKLTPLYGPEGKGRGKRTSYMREEIELFAARDWFALEQWQRKFRARLARGKK